MNSKKFFWGTVLLTLFCLVIFASPTIIMDPFFHYRAPAGYYDLSNQRYQNDGIARHFEYDALIIGSSMTENFRTSEFDQLFNAHSIKLPYSGAGFKEIDAGIKQALNSNNELKMVLRSVDLDYVKLDKDNMRYEDYPSYLYDENPFNDVNYFLNKEVLLGETKNALKNQNTGKTSTTFDMYCSWEVEKSLEEQIREGTFKRGALVQKEFDFSEEDRMMVLENINQNIIQTVKDNPDVTFYLFFPPYSSIYFDTIIRNGGWKSHIAMQECVINELLKYDNIELYSFFDYYEMICDLNNYKDMIHYSPEISSWILKKIAAGEGQLTSDNYQNYLDNIEKYYIELDRDGYFDACVD